MAHYSHLFYFWSVVRVVSGKINFTGLLCREFNIFLRTSITTSVPHDWRLINVRFNVGIEEQPPGVDVYDVP